MNKYAQSDCLNQPWEDTHYIPPIGVSIELNWENTDPRIGYQSLRMIRSWVELLISHAHVEITALKRVGGVGHIYP